MAQTLIAIWVIVWVAATLFAAAFIGNTDNVHGSGDASFPTFVIPLLFGWMWPGILALALIVGPLAILSDRTTKRASRQKDQSQ